MLRIQFAEIPENGLLVDVADVSWFPDGVLAKDGNPEGRVILERSGERVLVNGSFKVVLVHRCDRCLGDFVSPCLVDFRVLVEVAATEGDSRGPLQDDHEYDSEEIEVVTTEGPVVDLGDLLYQQMLLALPLKVLCNENCLGICEKCGANRNLESCTCQESSENSAFAALGRLVKKNN